MFKISEDPLEQNTIDATDYDALTAEEQAAYDELVRECEREFYLIFTSGVVALVRV